jgi:hypothetical protein
MSKRNSELGCTYCFPLLFLTSSARQCSAPNFYSAICNLDSGIVTADGQPVCFGVRPPSGIRDQVFSVLL